MIKQRTLKSVHYLALIFVSILIFAPILFGLWLSLLPENMVARGDIYHWNISLHNYWVALTTTSLLQYFANTMFVALAVMVCQLIFDSLAAYAFVFPKYRMKNIMFYVFLSTMMIPFEARIFPNLQTIHDLGWMNHFSGLILPFASTTFGIFMLRQTFMQIPTELRDACEIEGLSHFQFLTRVVMPYSRVTLATLGMLSFLSSWNMYLWPLLMTTDDSKRTVQIGLRQLQSEDTFNSWGKIMASAILIALPTLVVLMIGQKTYRTKLTEGAIK